MNKEQNVTFINKFANYIGLLIISICVTLGVFAITNTKNNDSLSNQFSSELFNINSSKVQQSFTDLGNINRNIPKDTKNEGICLRYPTYGTSLENITEEEKDNLIKESSLIFPGTNTYTSLNKDGNYLLDGNLTGKKIYKHTASIDMYEGNVSNEEKAVIRKIDINATIWRNYITGLYAAPGEIIKLEISQDDLEKIDSLTIAVGQVTHKNTINNIWKARNDFSRMPTIAGLFKTSETTFYFGTPMGGPIYLYHEKLGNFSCTISGAVTYPFYIHGYTTYEDFNKMSQSSAPYFDFEIWDKGVRHSGPKSRANFDYENLLKVGDLWEKICRTSNRVPTNSSADSGVGYIYDPFVAAGEAVAFVGGRIAVNAPLYWMHGALNYDSMVNSGFWGQIHEFNHHFQNYGMSGASTNEVTNNATSLLSYILYTNISSYRTNDDSSLSGWNRYLDPSISLKETLTNTSSQNGLNTYADIIHSFGVDNFIAATRKDTKKYTPTSWYQALSEVIDYDFSYYFETLLHQQIDEDVKNLYKDRKKFIPIASLYQTGRNYYSEDVEYTSNTVKPFYFKDKTDFILDFDKFLVYPSEFSCSIKNITSLDNGYLQKISDNKYRYVPNDKRKLSGEFKITFHLENSSVANDDISLTFNLGITNGNPEKCIYRYDSQIYSSPDEALNNNFDGYSSKDVISTKSTFLNGISANSIGYLNGKILIPSDGKYSLCLRAGRGNHALYLSSDGVNYKKYLEFSGDKNTFDNEASHNVVLNLKKGDFLYYKQITISNNHPDAYTELGWSINDNNTVSIQSTYLYDVNATINNSSFVSEVVYPYTYNENYIFYKSDISKEKIISVNQGAWDDTTKIDNILDGNPDTFYHSNNGNYLSSDNPFEIIIDLGESKTWNSIKLTRRQKGVNHLPIEFSIFGSGDSNKFEKVAEITKDNAIINGITSSAVFEEKEFRYIKLIVTDTSLQSGNKYICLSDIELSYTQNMVSKSNNLLEYYGDFSLNNKYLSSYGHLIEGKGTIKYTGDFSNFVLFVRQKSACQIKVIFDNHSEIINLSADDNLSPAFIKSLSKKSQHTIIIEVLEGTLSVDSFMTI